MHVGRTADETYRTLLLDVAGITREYPVFHLPVHCNSYPKDPGGLTYMSWGGGTEGLRCAVEPGKQEENIHPSKLDVE